MKIKKLLALLLALALVLTSFSFAAAEEPGGIKTVDVTFTAEGKVVATADDVQVGDTLTKPADPTPSSDDYSFTGNWLYNGKVWNFAGTVEGQAGPNVPANIELAAEIVAKEYIIDFDVNGGKETIQSIKQAYGTEITTVVADPTKEGYIFAGWVPEIPERMPSGGQTCVAQWEPDDITVTFSFGNYEGVPEDVEITQKCGTDLTAPAIPEREGYTATGWSPEVDATMPTAAKTYVLQWGIGRYTATFYADYEGAEPASVTITDDYGTPLKEKAPAFTREGYTQNGWDKEVPTNMPAENTEYTAQWNIKENKVVFVDSGATIASLETGAPAGAVPALVAGENKFDTVTVKGKFGDPVTVPSWHRNGYTLQWMDANGERIAADAIVATIPDAETTTYTADWIPDFWTLSVTFDGDEEKKVGPQAVYYGTDIDTLTEEVRVAAGNTRFAPTAESPTKTDGSIFDGFTAEITQLMPNEDLIVTSKWKAGYAVTFELSGQDAGQNLTFSTPIAPTPTAQGNVATILAGRTFTKSFVDGLPTAIRVGYELKWVDKNGTGDVYTNDTVINADVTLYSEWDASTHTVTFDVDGGSPAPAAQTVGHNGYVLLPDPEPTKDGYKFLGWYNGSTEFNFTTRVTTDLTLKAKWGNLEWTVQALAPNNTVTTTGVTIATTKNNQTVASTVDFTDLVQWQDWVDLADAHIPAQDEEKGGWYVGVRMTAPVNNYAGSKGVTPGTEGALAANTTYDYWILITVDKVREALRGDGFIKDTISGKLTYPGTEVSTEISQQVAITIDVRNTTLKNNTALTKGDIPNAIVTEDKAEKTVDITFDANGGKYPNAPATDVNNDAYDADGNWFCNIFYGNKAYAPGDQTGPIIPVYPGHTFFGWKDAKGNKLVFDQYDMTPGTYTADTTYYAIWKENWWFVSAVKPDGTGTTEGYTEGKDQKGNPLITFTDYSVWRQKRTVGTVQDKWFIQIRLSHLKELGAIGNEPTIYWYKEVGNKIGADPAQGTGYTPADHSYKAPTITDDGVYEAWLEIDPDEIHDLIANKENAMIRYSVGIWGNANPDTTGAGDGTWFAFDLDFTNIDLVSVVGDEIVHDYVVENGVEQLFDVTFDPDNESAPTTVQVWKGNKVAEPALDPEKEGYEFDGWYTVDEEGALVEEYDFDTLVTGSFTLKANWYPIWKMEPAVAGGGVVSPLNKMEVKDAAWKVWQDKAGEEKWSVRVKFTAPDSVDITKAFIAVDDGEKKPITETTGQSHIETISFSADEIETWVTEQECEQFYTIVLYNDENDEEGQLFILKLDVTPYEKDTHTYVRNTELNTLVFFDGTKSDGAKNFVVIGKGTDEAVDKDGHPIVYKVPTPIKWAVTFNPDNNTAPWDEIVVDNNYVANPGPVERLGDHYEFDDWRKLSRQGGVSTIKYNFATPVNENFTLQPKWKHGYWDVDESNVNGTYDEDSRTMYIEDSEIPYDYNYEGYLVKWKIICPDSLNGDDPEGIQARRQMRVHLPGEVDKDGKLIWRKFNDLRTAHVHNGQWYIDCFVTITEEEMLALAENKETKKLEYFFAPEGNEGDAVKITIDISPENMKFVNIDGTQTKIVDWKQVFEVTFILDWDEEKHEPIIYKVQDVEVGGTATEPTEEIRAHGDIVTRWDIFEGELRVPYDFETPVTEHIALVAYWTPLWTVTFYYDDGTEPVPVEVLDEELVAKPEDPVKQGYTFFGWIDLDAPEDADYFDFSTPITRNVNLQAYYEKNETVTQNGYSAAFQDDLKMAFYYILTMELHDDPTAKATLTGEDGFVNLEKAIVGDGEAQGENYYVATVPIKYFRKDITVKLFKGDEQVEVIDKDGETDDTTFVKSLEDYVEDVNASEKTSANMKALANALKWYGYAAENKFLSGTNDMSGMTAVPEPAEDELIDYGDKSVLAGMGIADVFTTVQFQEANKLNVIFTPAEGSKLEDYTFTIDGKEVDALVVGGDWYVQLSKIFAKNLSDDHVFTISDGTTTYSVTASVTRYAKTIVKKNVGGESMVNLAKAIINYNEAAKKYFANK